MAELDDFEIFQQMRRNIEAVRTYCLNIKASYDGVSGRNSYSAGRCVTAEEILHLLKGEPAVKSCENCKDFDPKNNTQCDECEYNPMNKSKAVIDDEDNI